MSNKRSISFLFLIVSMVVFGTIGVFRRYIPLPSSVIAVARGAIGSTFLAFILLFKKKSTEKIGKGALALTIISGGLIGINWILLFEAYNYTSVGVATLCYYTAPVFVILASPLFVGEKLTLKKLICVFIAILGMIPVSGVLSADGIEKNEIKGILFGIGAALFYASVVLINKRVKNIPPYEKTTVQLASAAITILPYTLITEKIASLSFDIKTILFLITVGILHTGIAYALYFFSISKLEAQSVALLSYIDPVIAILLSAALLGENIGIKEYIGALLILGSMLACEISFKKSRP